MPDGSRHRTSWRSALADPVGRQVQDRGGVGGDPEERAQVAELEAAVDEGGPRPGLAEGDGEVEGDRGLADAALRRVDDDASSSGSLSFAARAAWCIETTTLTSSKPENGIAEDARRSRRPGSRATGLWGTVRTTTGMPEVRSRGAGRRPSRPSSAPGGASRR